MNDITIAIIDVKKTKASVLIDLLGGLSYHVLGSYSSAENILSLCLHERPHIVILGIGEEGNPSGIALVESLRTLYYPLLIYCSEHFHNDSLKTLLPAQGYIVPPFNAGQLKAILSTAFEKNSAVMSGLAEDKFRQMFMNIPEYCYIVSPEGLILDINNAALQVLGYTRDEILGRSLATIFHPDSRDSLRTLVEKWEKGLVLHDERIDIVTSSGQRRKVTLHASPIRDEKGSILHIISYQRDITDLDSISDAFQESERKYRDIFVNAPVGIFQTTSSGKVIAVNGKMASILGYESPEEAIASYNDIGRELYVDPVRRNQFLEMLSSVGSVTNFEYEAYKNDGSTIWISMDARISTRNSDGSFLIDGFSQDVTARKNAHVLINMGISHMVLINELNADINRNAGTDEIVKKTCDRLKDIYGLHFCDCYFKVISSDYNEFLVFQYSNMHNVILASMEKLTGLSLQKIRIPLSPGSVYTELYSSKTPMDFNGKEEVARAIRDFVSPDRKALRALAGEVARIAGNQYAFLAPLVVRGETIGHIGFNRDRPFLREEKESVNMIIDKLSSIFDRIRTDEALRSSVREKDILLKEIHHRVKNNMQIISSLLSLQSGFITDERDLELFADSQNRIRSMSLIHEQLYQSNNLSQIDFSSYTARLVSEVLQSFNTGARISVDMDIIDTPLAVNIAIPCALILNELLSNAIKHAFQGRDGGHVDISFRRTEEHRYVFSVHDDGIGFNGSAESFTGKSLGMHLITELTRQLGGKLHISGKNGTTFTIEFSDIYEPPRDEKFSCMEPRLADEKLILIVEDDLITGNFLKKMLEKREYRIPPVMVTGESAISFVRQCRPDLVIMDILLGGPMDGIETARIIKEQYGVPVIFSSGNSEDATLTRVQKIRPAGFILKPIDKERLLSLVRQVLGG